MSTAFLAALKAKAPAVHNPEKTPTPFKPISPVQALEPEPIVNVEIILDRQRLDVFFDRKPSTETLDRLKGFGFRYRPSDKSWFHKDTESNREFLNHLFNLNLELNNNFVISPDYFAAEKEEVKHEELNDTQPASPEYVKFKTQVNELMAELKVDAADLMLLAIDNLHKVKFGKN